MARILIAGCGYVGSKLAEILAGDGHEVWALRRGEAPAPTGARTIRADLLDVDRLRALPSGIEVAFYTASAGGGDDRAYRSAYVDGLRYLLAALDSHPIRRILYTSSTGVYAQSGGEWVDEDSAAEPEHFSGRRLLEGEHLLLGSRFPATVVRLAGIYGPGRSRLVERVRQGDAVIPGRTPVYANRIHRDDCALVLRHLMTLESPAPLYAGADHEPADLATVLRWIADRLGVSPPRIEAAETGARYGRASSKRVRNERLLASGYRFRYPTFREGYGELIARDGATGD
jgi:nucleoside-diphosphate-sugar epimerase